MKYCRLSECKINKDYWIEKIDVENLNIKNQLNNFGLIVGEKIKLLNNNYFKKAVLIKVFKINYAIDFKIADKIIVKYE